MMLALIASTLPSWFTSPVTISIGWSLAANDAASPTYEIANNRRCSSDSTFEIASARRFVVFCFRVCFRVRMTSYLPVRL